jgi:predicted nuclease with TOPRIM domain
MMKEQLEKRLAELRAEFEKGRTTLQELEAKTASVRETMLRLAGAIQVLQEVLDQDGADGADGAGGKVTRLNPP